MVKAQSPLANKEIEYFDRRSLSGTAFWKELWTYRELALFLVLRSVKIRYAQSVLGFAWAIIQPLAQMLVFTLIFGRLVGVSSDGSSYAIFAFAALVPWTYFSNALQLATNSLTANYTMLSKVYFPRVILPVSEVFARLVDFAIAMVLLAVMLPFFGGELSVKLLVLPLLVVIMIVGALGAGLWLSSLSVQYRDIGYAATFLMQLFMYASPVVYSVSLIPETYLPFYALNPMVGVIDGFRASLLGSSPLRWDLIAISGGSALLLLATGAAYFRKREPIFADVG